MTLNYEPVIGLEVHAVLATRAKMFCDCRVVDSTHGFSNDAVCPVCSGMPGVLPVINRKAIEYALRVALALDCEIATTSIFERKSYFYPDLPKGYQISQYQRPLAHNGRLTIETSLGEQTVGVRRVHLEEDTGKLIHVHKEEGSYSLVDLNRSGIPLLEIVTEPDMHTVEVVRTFAYALRGLLRYLGVNSGNLEKGLLRVEPNISIRPVGSLELGTRTEIKNLNSFRSLERAVAYEIERQTELLRDGGQVVQQTVGWDEDSQTTVPQRSKEEAEDYRYFPDPDLPPLVIDPQWIEEIRSTLPELPYARYQRFKNQYGLSAYDAEVLVSEKNVADFYEDTLSAAPDATPKTVANWVSGELFGLLNQKGLSIEHLPLSPGALGDLLQMVAVEEINKHTGKRVLEEMLESGDTAEAIVTARGLKQISDAGYIADLVARVLEENREQVTAYLEGKETVSRWLFGQVMGAAGGKANPQVVQTELVRQLGDLKGGRQI
jgi:aspartyl-tRNA(Asn)/glutamyl-tRNA(Gln) amidotransferase subunit B